MCEKSDWIVRQGLPRTALTGTWRETVFPIGLYNEVYFAEQAREMNKGGGRK